ncbi:MAG: hypothetical protein IJJ41_02945 [Clostridia bacterium]|nr:hypothetical protein [Clostridia bacterium]
MLQTVFLAKGAPLNPFKVKSKFSFFALEVLGGYPPNKLPFLPKCGTKGLLATLTQRKFAFLFFGWFLPICNIKNFKQEEKYLAYNKKTCEEVKKILKDYKPLPIEINREQKRLVRVPKDADFEMKLGNTTYEVAGHFNKDGDEFLLNQLIRNLKN